MHYNVRCFGLWTAGIALNVAISAMIVTSASTTHLFASVCVGLGRKRDIGSCQIIIAVMIGCLAMYLANGVDTAT